MNCHLVAIESELARTANTVNRLREHLSAKGQTIEQSLLEHLDTQLGQPRLSRYQQIVCAAIPVYNMFATAEGWPVLPLPSFCATPAIRVTPSAN